MKYYHTERLDDIIRQYKQILGDRKSSTSVTEKVALTIKLLKLEELNKKLNKK